VFWWSVLAFTIAICIYFAAVIYQLFNQRNS
jgi:cbb3-type cytochrome oxidase subunit 3